MFDVLFRIVGYVAIAIAFLLILSVLIGIGHLVMSVIWYGVLAVAGLVFVVFVVAMVAAVIAAISNSVNGITR